eukprot:scaffold14210_cov26-Phaeocystis_antarctica.AAC.2
MGSREEEVRRQMGEAMDAANDAAPLPPAAARAAQVRCRAGTCVGSRVDRCGSAAASPGHPPPPPSPPRRAPD